MTRILNSLCVVLFAVVGLVPLRAQEAPARRLSSIVGVAVEEYAKGIDARGRLVSQLEYEEAVSFLADARSVAERLSGERATAARQVLDSLIAAVREKRLPAEVARIHRQFVEALGSEGALEMPTAQLDVAAGGTLYAQRCASCHGERGLGDGPAASGMQPPPPAIGSARDMAERTPALLYRVISVGVSGTPMSGWASTLTPQERWNIVAYLHSLRSSPADRLEGEGLFLQRCSMCHGAAGEGGGPVARALTRVPPEVGSLAWQAERSDAQLAAAVRGGVPGTAMPPSADLSDRNVAKLVAHLRSLPTRRVEGPGPVASGRDSTADGVARSVLRTLDQALAAAAGGRSGDAGDRAFDAYIAFEPLEAPARARSPGLVSSIERHFAEFKAAVNAGDVRRAQRSRDAIEAQLPAVVDLGRRASGFWATLMQSFLIILREGFEAILVLGAIATFLNKTGHAARLRLLWLGAGVALVASAATAIVLQTVLRAMPASREIIEGVTMLIAVAVLFSVSYWLISKVEAARWQQFIRDKVSNALAHGGGKALAFVAFLAVYREGAETALFYQALFGEGTGAGLPIALGIVVGSIVLAVIFVLFYRFGVRIPLRPFFAVTSVLLYFMAFAFTGKGMRELQEGNVVPLTMLPGFPTIDALGIYPTVETLLPQLLLIVLFVFALARTFWPKRAVALPTVAAPAAAGVGDVERELVRLREATARLEARIDALERSAPVDATLLGAKEEGD